MTGRPPAVGDLVDLPAWLGGELFRVLEVREAEAPGWVRLSGYAMGADGGQRLGTHLVPLDGIRVRAEHWLAVP